MRRLEIIGPMSLWLGRSVLPGVRIAVLLSSDYSKVQLHTSPAGNAASESETFLGCVYVTRRLIRTCTRSSHMMHSVEEAFPVEERRVPPLLRCRPIHHHSLW